MAAAKKEAEQPEARPADHESLVGVPAEEKDESLTPRQRTKMEKRDAALPAEPEDGKCINHSDRDSVVETDGVLHSVQAFCEECAVRVGIPVPKKD